MSRPIYSERAPAVEVSSSGSPGQVVDEGGGEDDDDVATSSGRRETARGIKRSTNAAVSINGHQYDHPVCQRLQHAQLTLLLPPPVRLCCRLG